MFLGGINGKINEIGHPIKVIYIFFINLNKFSFVIFYFALSIVFTNSTTFMNLFSISVGPNRFAICFCDTSLNNLLLLKLH